MNLNLCAKTYIQHFDYFKFRRLILNKSIKRLSIAGFGSGGRNTHGRTTSYHRGKSIFKKHFLIDFARMFMLSSPGFLVRLDLRFRNKFYNLIVYDSGYLGFCQSVEGIDTGDMVLHIMGFPLYKNGGISSLNLLPIGTTLFNLPFLKDFKKTFSTAPGTFSKLLRNISTEAIALVELPSGEKRFIPKAQSSFLGRLKSFRHIYGLKRKAGDNHLLGRKPVVRGVAMNPIDHPHGGGQGKTSGGQPSVSPWGLYTKGARTSANKNLKFKIKRDIKK
jgi:large subunit ribosomal protein L2